MIRFIHIHPLHQTHMLGRMARIYIKIVVVALEALLPYDRLP